MRRTVVVFADSPGVILMVVLSLRSHLLGGDSGHAPFLARIHRLGARGVASGLSPNRAPSAHAAAKEIHVEIPTLHEEQSQNGKCDMFFK